MICDVGLAIIDLYAGSSWRSVVSSGHLVFLNKIVEYDIYSSIYSDKNFVWFMWWVVFLFPTLIMILLVTTLTEVFFWGSIIFNGYLSSLKHENFTCSSITNVIKLHID